MSSDLAIRANQLSKCYHLYDHPHERLKQSIYPRLQRLARIRPKQYFRQFWALKDVSFEIKKGETVGIIGRNGSGKSTLLQLICGTLNPTEGNVRTHGRVAALLELGSGFNPEFTGRENVYMSAAVLGLSPAQIRARYRDIIAFADIGDFVDQPIKTYSSGMMVRLAFAVIAHVDAEILVVDEALAVGDAVFTQKCMRFIRDFQKHGTLVFVSHDTAAVQNLCQSAIWLDQGRVSMFDTSKAVAEAYLQFTSQILYGRDVKITSLHSNGAPDEGTVEQASSEPPRPTVLDYEAVATVADNTTLAKGWRTGDAEIETLRLSHLPSGAADRVFKGGERVRITIRARAHKPLPNPILGFLVRDRLGQDLFGENTLPFTDRTRRSLGAGSVFEGIFDFRLPMLPNGEYAVMASVADGNLTDNIQHHWLHDALIIKVSSSKVRWGLIGISFENVRLEVLDEREQNPPSTVC